MSIFAKKYVVEETSLSISVRTVLSDAYNVAQRFEYTANNERRKRKRPPKTPAPVGRGELLRALLMSGGEQIEATLREMGVTPDTLKAWQDAQR